jgi:cytochrome oxidase assembly protein ShyY1
VGRFLLRPRWLAGLALVILVVVSFVRLGFWQLHRLDERHAYEDLVSERLAAAPMPLGDALASGSGQEDYRRVVASGTFDPKHEVILYGRTQGDQSGNHVVTPLILADGTAVAVDRGWVPLPDASPPLPDATPPTGVVRVSGVLFPTEADDAGEAGAATQRTFSRLNLPALAAQVPYALAPAYLLLGSQDPPQTGLPLIAPLPDPAESPPHLSYAIQWFTFSAIAVVGFVILVRREYRRSGAAEAVHSPDGDRGKGSG